MVAAAAEEENGLGRLNPIQVGGVRFTPKSAGAVSA
jgi:hypothetical protein